MERHVKERLVGAAVLMAAAVILIPEMLSGPDREPAPEAVRTTNESGIKTYTIDLGDASASTQKVEIQAAPPQEPAATAPDPLAAPPSASAEADQASPESAPASSSPTSTSPRQASESTERSVPERERVVARTEPATTRATVPPGAPQSGDAQGLASEPAIPTSRGWAVQLGSFSNRDSAERLAREFQAERYDAFVMPVKSGAATLYRVRLGPMKDRSAAEDALKRAKVKVSGAAVVAHP